MSWPVVKLKDCCQVIGGATPKRNVSEYWCSPDVPWVTPKDVSNLAHPVLDDAPEYISQKGFKSCATSMLPKGSVLVTSRAPIGNVAIAGRDMCTNQGFKSLVPGADVCGVYLYYCMSAFSRELQSLGNGATFKEVSKKIVEEFEIPLPPLDEQKRIAAILDKADAIRRKRQQAIKLADEFLRSVFLDMFGDPVTNPKGWEVKQWNECLNIVNGKNQKAVEIADGSYPICGSGGEMGRARDYLTRANSVIIGRKGNINNPILMKECFWNVDTAFGLEPNAGVLSHNYLYWFCKFFDFERLNKAVTIPSLTKVDLLQIQIPVPDYESQKGFDSVVAKVDELNSRFKIFTEQPLFESLSQKAFAGEL